MTSAAPSLYAAHQKIHPKYQPGFFRWIKWATLWFLLGIYYLVPLIRWDRGPDVPDQAVLFDLPARKFYIFDLVIWPQEIFLLVFVLIIAAVGLFFITALAGRVFCGYICFQTVWTDLFIYAEKWIEGDRNRRIRLDKSPWNARKITIKVTKHLAWLVISLATGGAFTFYFADAPTLFLEFLTGTAPYAAWFTLAFLTLTTYTMAGLAREQVCLYMCPYARFQGAMFDEDTLLIAYDEGRGEPRVGNRRQRRKDPRAAGDCIDCMECVRVCPTGIDIRDGQQYQCITCAACIDACDSVMDRVKRPHGLIRYTSSRGLQGLKTRIIRTRVVVYTAIMVLAAVALAWQLQAQVLLEMSVIRHRKPVFIQQSDGAIQNNFTVRILNRTPKNLTYHLTVDGLPGGRMKVGASNIWQAVQTDPSTNAPAKEVGHLLSVGSGEAIPFSIYLRQPPSHLEPGSTEITFHLQAVDDPTVADGYTTVFMRP
ncbi:MAG: cytochrome c oxidase accessory protein CcoG [Magnetococcales bacterium]|nr:cytochrome c oxidase accessory protein CcoG [Magnetococcales bacterium]